jgi:hypothetical protein
MRYFEGEHRLKKTNIGRPLVLHRVLQWVKASTPGQEISWQDTINFCSLSSSNIQQQVL